MKNYSKVLFVAALLLISVVSEAQLRFGPQVGLNIANASLKAEGAPSTSSKIGLSIGAIAEYSLSESMALQSGLIYSQKGYKGEMNLFIMDAKATVSISYIELPVNFKYFVPVGTTKIFLAAGPYVAFAVSGTEVAEVSSAFVDAAELGLGSTSKDLKIGSGSDDDVLGADFGLNIGAGAEFKSFVVSGQYGFGLINIEPISNNGSYTKNRVVSLSVAYLFGGK